MKGFFALIFSFVILGSYAQDNKSVHKKKSGSEVKERETERDRGTHSALAPALSVSGYPILGMVNIKTLFSMPIILIRMPVALGMIFI